MGIFQPSTGSVNMLLEKKSAETSADFSGKAKACGHRGIF
jgi:hypothetical protein